MTEVKSETRVGLVRGDKEEEIDHPGPEVVETVVQNISRDETEALIHHT